MFIIFWAGRLTAGLTLPMAPAFELVEAYPSWIGKRFSPPFCREANAHERRTFELAVNVMEEAARTEYSSFMKLGAARDLSSGLYRHEGDKTFTVCPPRDTYARIFKAMDANPSLLAGRPVEWHLALLGRLPQHNERLAKQVGDMAFNEHPQESDVRWPQRKDLRPLGRTTLAGFGRLAMPWRDQAFAAMSEKDSLGTGAAQVAVATGHPEALGRVVRLMEGMLGSVPKEQVLKWDMRHRLRELAYAIALAGDDARQHLGPITAALGRKVQNWAPPFGMIEIDAGDMCEILFLIEGRQSPTALAHSTCRDR